MFPVRDYIIEFGAGLYFINAGQFRGECGEILPVSVDIVDMFCQKALRSGDIDPVVLRHLMRNAKDNFKVSSSVRERTLDSHLCTCVEMLVETFCDYSVNPRPLERLDPQMSATDRIDLMMKNPMWYQLYNEDDRRQVALAYESVGETLDSFRNQSGRAERVHKAASLIVPEGLTEPSTILARRRVEKLQDQQLIVREGREELRSKLLEGDFSTITPAHKKDPESLELVAQCVSQLVTQLENKDDTTIVKVLFGPPVCAYKLVATQRGRSSENLDDVSIVRSAINEGRVELLGRIDDDRLQRVVDAREGFVEELDLKRIGGRTAFGKVLRARLRSLSSLS